jgi:hypothetical protein
MLPDAPRPLLLAASLLGLAALLGGCGSSAECVIDSDCPTLTDRCEANACVPLGGPAVDLGAADLGRTDGGLRDGAPADGALRDGEVLDAGAPAALVGMFTAQGGASDYVVSASFTETPASPPGPCTTHDDGPCSVSLCTAGASTSIPHSAGSLTVTGGSTPISLEPGADETYTAAVGTPGLFSPGTVLTFNGSGSSAGVPVFSGTVTAPAVATLVTPSIVDATPIAVSHTDPLALAWSLGGPIGFIEVTFSTVNTSTGDVAIAQCRFPATDFGGSIPATAFDGFEAGTTGSYSLIALKETALALDGGWDVTLAVRSPMATPAGTSTGAATF